MILSIDNLVYFLFEKKLVDWDLLKSKKFVIKTINRRNFSFEFRSDSVNLFIKQCKFSDDSNVRIFRNEASFYEMIQEASSVEDKSIFPRFFQYDSKYQIVVLELLTKEIDFSGKPRAGQTNLQYFTHLIKAVSSFHSIKFKDHKVHSYPWIFSIDDPDVQQSVGGESKDTKWVIEIIINNAISELRGVTQKYEHKVLIHNDLKLENVIIEKNGRVAFIDLETVQLGDELWDFASLVYSLIFETHFFKLNLNISSYELYHPIADNQDLVNTLKNHFFINYSVNSLEDQIKFIQFLGCVILKRLVERKDQYQQASLLTLLSKDIITNPQPLLKLFHA